MSTQDAKSAVNVENINRVADAIEAADKSASKPVMGFNMSDWVARSAKSRPDQTGHGCGTVACIAGWSWFVNHGNKPKRVGPIIEDDAQDFLGTNWRQSIDLFYGSGLTGKAGDTKPAHAVAVLRHLAKTGEVDWSIGAPEKGAA